MNTRETCIFLFWSRATGTLFLLDHACCRFYDHKGEEPPQRKTLIVTNVHTPPHMQPFLKDQNVNQTNLSGICIRSSFDSASANLHNKEVITHKHKHLLTDALDSPHSTFICKQYYQILRKNCIFHNIVRHPD